MLQYMQVKRENASSYDRFELNPVRSMPSLVTYKEAQSLMLLKLNSLILTDERCLPTNCCY